MPVSGPSGSSQPASFSRSLAATGPGFPGRALDSVIHLSENDVAFAVRVADLLLAVAEGGAVMRIIVVGGSAAGQFTALLLARAGHEVVLLDRDPVEPASDIEAAASAFRPAVPQFVQPHIVLPRCRLLLRQALPDVYAALLAAGCGRGRGHTRVGHAADAV